MSSTFDPGPAEHPEDPASSLRPRGQDQRRRDTGLGGQQAGTRAHGLGPVAEDSRRGPLDAARLVVLARAAGLGATVVEEIDSTNAALVRAGRGEAGEPALRELARAWRLGGDGTEVADRGHVLVAERQTAGRGRLDRAWVSRPGAGLTVSLLLRLPVPPARLGWLPLVVGMALASTVRSVAGLPATLKWPNDVLVDGAKLAGVLVELVPIPPADPSVVIGFGLNVHAERDELPERSTSLRLCDADPRALDRTALLGSILGTLVTSLDAWAADPERARDAYLELCGTIGRQVRVELPDGTAELGTATDVDSTGRLVVDGRAYSAGDIIHLR
ncbi:putative biotin-ligase [Frankia canadensis]|uniref:biotin--[biotin carboxyl-carrier protein] ligase n=1 Tax=Frankia canadensis TaxID=1836972 RepID=A0A2I2KL49_9ACTN|nr:biotin--[acetyl-CoA-carboxylase] ligase [Frankia canadensis]SNQ46398.1 putative biotin-ligase [Frankia canadensis]SOU53688.1 putative biotin-ligase [Frankia canadensis]